MLVDVRCLMCSTEEEHIVKDTMDFSVTCAVCGTVNNASQRVDTPGKGGTFVLKGDGWFNSEGGY